MIQQREASGSICHPDASRLLLKGLFFQVCFDVAGDAAHERVDRFARGPCVVGRSEQTVGVAQGEQPFFSYGLTSLVSAYISMGVVLNVSLQRNVERDDEIFADDFRG